MAAEAAPAPQIAARASGDLKTLMDRFQKETGRTRQGVIPIAIAFPEIGPSLFLVAELTPETQSPSIEFLYRRTLRQGQAGGR